MKPVIFSEGSEFFLPKGKLFIIVVRTSNTPISNRATFWQRPRFVVGSKKNQVPNTVLFGHPVFLNRKIIFRFFSAGFFEQNNNHLFRFFFVQKTGKFLKTGKFFRLYFFFKKPEILSFRFFVIFFPLFSGFL